MACSIRGKLDSSLVCNAVNTSVCLRVPVLWKGRFLRIVNDVSCCRLQTVTFRECDYSEVHCLSHIFSLNMCWQYWSLVVVEMVMTCCCCLGSLSLCCHTSRSCRQCHCLHHVQLPFTVSSPITHICHKRKVTKTGNAVVIFAVIFV